MEESWRMRTREQESHGFPLQYCNVDRSRRAMGVVTSLRELKELARHKFGFDDGDELQVVLSKTGADIDDDKCLQYLNQDVLLDIINTSRGEAWSHPPFFPGQPFGGPISVLLSSDLSQPRSDSSPDEMNYRKSGGPIQWTLIQAEQVQLGDKTIFQFNGDQPPAPRE